MKIIEDPTLLEVLIDDCRKEVFEKLTHKVPPNPDDPSSYNFIECRYPDGKSVRYYSELHFKDYFLVPVFVNAEKNFEKICLLNVTDKVTGTMYYYILVKKDHCDDFFPLPAATCSSGELQLNAKKTLILDDSNQCLRVFLDSRGDAQFTPMYLYDNVPGYRRDDPEISILQDHILCVASGTAAIKFVESYHLSDKVMNHYKTKGFLLLRIDSFSYEKLKTFLSTLRSEPSTIIPTSRFQQIFENSKYLKEEKIFPYIHDHIKTISETTWQSQPIRNILLPYLWFFNLLGMEKAELL